uniref:glutamate racemase n=1 Tax=Flavobacterium sp. TaxID=239 RepID=UPI0040490AAE
MNNSNPIGFFDSGVGGTSIWKEVNLLLPNENTIYLADSKNAPYGIKSKQEIIDLSFKNTQLLMEMGCKLIVVACNTATTNAIAELRAHFKVPFIGIEPAIKPAVHASETKKIGILATKGTINSTLFNNAVLRYKHIDIIEQIGSGLVDLIENGLIDSNETFELLKRYLEPMVAQNIDYLVLGCSHYPYLIPIIQKIIPDSIQIIDSGQAVAKQTKNILKINDLPNQEENSKHIFYSNANQIDVLKNLIGLSYDVKYLDF